MGRSFHIISVASGASSPGGGAKTCCPLRGKSRVAGKGVHLPRSGCPAQGSRLKAQCSCLYTSARQKQKTTSRQTAIGVIEATNNRFQVTYFWCISPASRSRASTVRMPGVISDSRTFRKWFSLTARMLWSCGFSFNFSTRSSKESWFLSLVL